MKAENNSLSGEDDLITTSLDENMAQIRSLKSVNMKQLFGDFY